MSRGQKIAGLVVLAFLIGLILTGGNDGYTSAQAPPEPTIMASGVIKTGTTGQWYIYEDNNHDSYCLDDIIMHTDNERVVVDLCRSDYKVTKIDTDVDETFVRWGINCGGSGGVGVVHILCTKSYDLNKYLDPSTIRNVYTNIWFQVEGILYE